MIVNPVGMRIRIRSTKYYGSYHTYVTQKTDTRKLNDMMLGYTMGVQQTHNINDARTYKSKRTIMDFLHSNGFFEWQRLNSKRITKKKPFGLELEVEKDGQIHIIPLTDRDAVIRSLTIIEAVTDPNSKQVTASGLAAFLLTLPDEPITINGAYIQVGTKSYSIANIL